MSNTTNQLIESSFRWQNHTNFEKSEYLYVPEDPIDKLFFLEEGEIRQFSISPVGEEITIHIFKNPAIIPLMVALSGSSNQFYFQAKTTVKCKSIEVDEFLVQMKNNPEFLFDTIKRFAGAIVGLSSRVNTMASFKQKDQLLGIIRYLALKQNPNTNSQGQLELNTISHAQLAQWLGCARETVSRLLTVLEKDGEITKSKKSWFIKP